MQSRLPSVAAAVTAALGLLTVAAAVEIAGSIVPRFRSPAVAWPLQRQLYYAYSKPAIASIEPGAPVELGVVFQPTVAGRVVGVRFYRFDGETGRSIGSLWTRDGQRLASIPFDDESRRGWQEAWFREPVEVQREAVLIASRFGPTAGPLVDGLSDLGTPLFIPVPALRMPTSFSQGLNVYHRNGSGFPSSDSGGRNFWVDVLFVPYSPLP